MGWCFVISLVLNAYHNKCLLSLFTPLSGWTPGFCLLLTGRKYMSVKPRVSMCVLFGKGGGGCRRR